VAEARATVDGDQAAFIFAEQDAQRYTFLSRNGASTKQNAQSSTSSVWDERAARDRDDAAVGAAQAQLGVLSAQLTQARAKLAQQQAASHHAALNLSYTTMT
jgi:membrane fusion protein, multidrug efflux system